MKKDDSHSHRTLARLLMAMFHIIFQVELSSDVHSTGRGTEKTARRGQTTRLVWTERLVTTKLYATRPDSCLFGI